MYNTGRDRLVYHMRVEHKLPDAESHSKAVLQRIHGTDYDTCTWRLGGTPRGNAVRKRDLRLLQRMRGMGVDTGTRAPLDEGE